jgi:hypothetical protein
MPTSGTATYLAFTEGSVYGPPGVAGGASTHVVGNLDGQGTLTADFSAGTLSGSFSGIEVLPAGGCCVGAGDAWNGFSVNATISGATFAGTSAVTSTPAKTDAYTMAAGAAGTVAGTFNGPSANELGAVWTLSDGVRSASGAIYAPKQNSPSDRRLKRDIEPLGRHASGARLYRYRYLGGERLFVGVMAQELLADVRLAGAVKREPDGFLAVDYAQLGLADVDAPAMRAAGEAAKRVWLAMGAVA